MKLHEKKISDLEHKCFSAGMAKFTAVSSSDLKDWAIAVVVKWRNRQSMGKTTHQLKHQGIEEFLIERFELTEEDLK